MAEDPKATEQKILDAAHDVFVEKGMDGTRMQEIANKAGINKALLHYYFRSKDKLFERVFSTLFASLINQLFGDLTSEKPIEVKIWLLVENYINFIKKNPGLPFFILGEMRKRENKIPDILHSIVYPNLQAMQESLDKEIEAGKIKAVKVEHLFMNIVSMSVFPFLAKPMLSKVFNMDDKAFLELMEERKKVIPEMLMAWLKS